MNSIRTYLLRPRTSDKDRIVLFKRLAFLLSAGMNLPEALSILASETRTKQTSTMLSRLHVDTSSGRAFAESLARFPHLFNDSIVHIVSTGEMTGTLAQTLAYLADTLKKQQALKRKVIGAFVYPTIITAAMLAITGFLVLYLFPKIMPIFTSLHMQLPLSTRIVIAVSTFLMHMWWVLILLASVCAVTVMYARKNMRVRLFFDHTCLKLPVMGSLLRSYNLISAARSLKLLLASVPLSVALTRTAEGTLHTGYKNIWRELAHATEQGDALSKTMSTHREYFPDIFTQLIAAGERSGTLSETLLFLETWYESDIDELTKNLSTLIEPVLMIVMGGIIGFVALSIIMPIYSITQNLHG